MRGRKSRQRLVRIVDFRGALNNCFHVGGLEFERDGLVEVDGRHAIDVEVSAVLSLQFMVLFGKDCADESDHGLVVWEQADDVGSPPRRGVDSLEWVGGPDFSSVVPGDNGVGG